MYNFNPQNQKEKMLFLWYSSWALTLSKSEQTAFPAQFYQNRTMTSMWQLACQGKLWFHESYRYHPTPINTENFTPASTRGGSAGRGIIPWHERK